MEPATASNTTLGSSVQVPSSQTEKKRNQTTLQVHHATDKWQSCCCCFIRKKTRNYFFVGLFVCLSKKFGEREEEIWKKISVTS